MLRARGAAGLALLTALLTAVPYLAALALTEPGTQFSGFLLNPQDGFSYLAKMRQGTALPFEFSLPYATQPGPGATLFVYHLALGWLGALIAVSPLWLYHLARLLGTLAMAAAAWALYRRALEDRSARGLALLLALLGSGIGWLALPFGVLASDLWIPEAIPFLSGYANAHFPLASALMLLAVALLAFDDLLANWRLPAAFAVGLGLSLIQPFAVLPVLVAVVLWYGWEAVRDRSRRYPGSGWQAVASFVLGSAPVLLYDLLATRRQAALALWAAQNSTPTPGLLETGLGYGLVLVLAAAGILTSRTLRSPGGRLLLCWAVAGLVLMYAPLALQRRMALGLFFPLAGLAGAALSEFISQPGRRRLAAVAMLAVSFPSHLVVVGAGLQSVSQGDPELLLLEAEHDSYAWIEANLPPDSLILSGARGGNRMPAFTEARVLYGHPFETPEADRMALTVEQFYQWSGDPAGGLAQLSALGVDFVLYGPEERQLGIPSWLDRLEPVHSAGEFVLYRVPAQ